MSLKFIFGPSGSGKSHTLYQYIIQESRKRPEQDFIVLVPEQFTMQTQMDLVTMHPNKGIMNIDVLSFGRLAHRVLEETGGGSLPILDDEGKSLILRKIAEDCEDELAALKGNMKRLGYISEVKSVISEFTQYDIGEEELERVIESAGEGTELYYKLKDIKVLYRGFTAYLQKKYITKEELLDVLSCEIGKSELLKNSTVVLDGFTGFTPVQNRLLKELLIYCREVIVTVIMDDREDPFICRHPYQLFALSKQMTFSLTEAAREAGILIEEPVYLYERIPYRFRENEEMAFLERNLFRYEKEVFDKKQDSIGIHTAGNPKEEAFAAAARVRELVRKEGYRYRDIGVIAGDMEVYGSYLEQAFTTYNIPFFMDHKRNILLNSFVEYIRSLLNMAEQNFTYESVFRFLRTDLSGLSYEEVCDMENYVIGLGIRGYKKWQERWVRRLKGMKEEDLERLNHSRVLFVEKIDDLIFVLRQRRKTVKDITTAVYEFMVKEEIQLRLKKQEEVFQAEGELALAKEYAQVYRIIIELFDKFAELLGDEPVSLSEYCKLLDAGLAEARVGVIPPSADQVVAGDVKRTRLKDIKVLLFVGANDVCLPGKLLRTGLLSERDRERFKKERLPLAPGGKEQAYIQKFYLYMNLTKPSKRLEIYYSKVSADGKSIRPSYLIQELKKLYPFITIQDEEEKGLKEKELTEKTGIWYLIQGFRDGDNEAWQELYAWYLRSPRWRGKVEELLRAGLYCRPTDGLTEMTARKLYGEDFEDSITRIERFSACAYAHFLTYGLSLRERQEYEFQAVDMGNICHSALELFSVRVKEEGLDWLKLSEEQRKEYIDESVEKSIADYGNSVLYSSARNEYMIVRMKRMLDRTVWALTKQLEAGDFLPEAYEFRFERGKIDRIDTCEDGDKIYVKVMDYKTGRKAFDVTALYHGLQLQLMVYMDAALRRQEKEHPGKEAVPAGVFYYRIQDPLVEKKPGDKTEEIEQAVLKELKPDGMINLRDEVLRHLERQTQGESLAVPVKFKKDGSLAKGSKAVPEDEFRAMMRHALKKIEETHQRILRGETDALPYKKGQESGCDYCRYRHVCRFDRKVPGYHYRDIDQMSKEEAIAAMKSEDGTWM